MTRLATLVLAAALLSACSSSDSPCQPCALLNNACVPVGECVPAQCSRPVVNSALPAEQVQKFGTLPVGREVSFNVPANTGSVTIVQQAQAANLTVVYKGSVIDNSAVPLTVTRPDGQKIYDDSTAGTDSSPDGGVDPSGDYAFYGGGTPSTSAFTFPNTSASLSAGVPAGTWKFVVNDYANECTFLSGCTDGGTAADTYEVSVITRALPAGSYVFIHHLIDSGDPAIADVQAAFQAALGRGQFRTQAQVRDMFNGLELVEPGLVPVPEWRPDRSTPSACDFPVLRLALAGVARKP